MSNFKRPNVETAHDLELELMFGMCPHCGGKPAFGCANAAMCLKCETPYKRNDESRAKIHNAILSTIGSSDHHFVS